MTHSFDVELAKAYGINAAILLQNLGYWVNFNEANQRNYHDGYYWTFSSRRALCELYPYLTERQIEAAFQKLIEKGFVLTGNYNETKYDRTIWYTLTEEGKSLLQNVKCISQNVKSISQKCQIDFTKVPNRNSENVKPIPDNITNVKTDIKTNRVKAASGFEEIIAGYTNNEEIRQALIDFTKMRKLIKKPLTERALSLLLSKLDTLARNDSEKVAVINQSITRSWAGFFPVKDGCTQQAPTQETETQRQRREMAEQLAALTTGGSQ